MGPQHDVAQLHSYVKSALSLCSNSQISKRRTGLKCLRDLCESKELLRVLDQQSISAQTQLPEVPELDTWPALVLSFIQIPLQIRQKGPDDAFADTLLKLLRTADDDKRSGYPSILHPISAQLFAHLVRLYENNSESVPSKYDDILAHLARHPAYVEAAQLQDIEKVVTLQAGRLERKTGKLSGEGVSITMLSNLSHLVQHTPAEMSSHQVLMLLDMFCSCGPVFLGSEATYRTKVAFFKLVNIYLNAYGRDVSGRCSSLLKALLGPTMAALNSNNDGLKDGAAEYLYIQLVLGGFEPLPSVESDDWMVLLERIFSWAIQQTKETKNWEADGPGGPLSSRMLHCSSTKLSLSKARHAARLAAFFIYPSLMGLDFSSRRRFEAEIEDSESDSRPVKKIRLSNTVFPSLQDLGLLAASTPSSGAIVACMALLRYRLAIPATCLEQWVDKTIDKLPRCFEEWISNKTSATLNELLWLLRYLLMLAECYDINHSISLSYPRRWHAVWDAMHSRLKDFQATASVREVVFWIMATMIKRQLHIPYPEQVLQVLKTRIHEEAPQNSPSPAEIALLGAYFSITGSQGLHSKKTAGQQKNEKWERDALSWAAKISFISGSNPSGDIGKIYHWEDALLFAVATYLHIPENNRVNHGSLQGGDKDPYPATPFGCQISCPWAWWALRLEEMNCEESHLLSGKMYVKARMLRMEAWKKLEEHQRTESEHRPFIVMAGDQRYKDVADILSNALHKALSKYENVMIDSNETSGILADDKRGIFLGQLLSICTMIVRLCTLVVLRQQDWKGDVVWGFLEQLLGQGVNTALAVLGNALPLVARMFSGFRTFEWRALHSLIESLAQCNTQLLQNTQVHTHREGMHLCLDDDFSRLRSCLKHILFYLNDASAARDSVRMATQARFQAVTSVQNVSFDEEFDMSGAGDTVNEEEELWGVASEKIKSSSSSARVVKYRAAQLLLLFANLTPVQVAHDVQDIIENTLQGEALGSDLSMQLVKVQVASAATAIRLSYHEAPQLVDVALNSLRSVLELGLGLWQHEKNERGANWRRLGFVSSELRTLCEALVSDHGLRTVSKSMDKAIKLFKFTLDCMSGANGKGCVPSRILTVQSHSALLLMRHSSQLIDAAVDISEQLLKKRQYDARLTGGKTLRLLLQSLDDPDLLFEAKLKPFLECSENESISSSMIIILADIATYCNKLEPKCLLLLSRMAAIPMVMACMDWIAMMLGYSDRWAYASWFLRQLCHMWLTEPELDVHALVGLRSLIAPSAEAAVNVDNFVPHVVPWLLPGIIWRNDAEALNQLASLMNVSCEELLANNLSVVFSSLLLLQSKEVAKPPTSWEDLVALLRNNVLLSRYFENGEDAVLIPKMKGVYLEGIKFVVTAARESCPTIETLSPDKASEILAGFLKPNRLLPLSENQVASCLLAVQTLLDMARSPEHAFQALGSLEALLLLLQADITRPASLRCVVMMLIRLMHRSPVLHAKSCKLLDEVVNWVINSGETVSIEIFGSLLPSISAALVAAIEKQADRAGLASGMLMPRLPPSPLAALDHFDVEVRDMASSTYVERSTETHRSVLILLNRLLCNSDTLPASWRQNLACIDPIPRKYGMEQASVAVARHRQQLEPWQQLNHFASRAASMSHTGRELSLSVLRSLLYSGQFISLKDAEAIKRSSEVWNDSDLYWHSKCRHVATQALHPSIKAAAWNLAHLSGDLGDANLTNFAGELLALVGPLPENELAFGPNHVLEDGIEAKEGATSSSFKGLDTTGKGIIKTFATAIRLMSEYLIDEDVSVVKLTQDTLRMTLPLPPSIEAVRILPAEVSSIVKIFSNEAIEPPQKWVSNLLSDPELWDVARYPSFNDWVCRLACAFLERAENIFLRCCNELSKVKPVFAELLLPLAFADLAIQGGGTNHSELRTDICEPISHAITKGLLPSCPDHPKAMSLLLKCLAYLRKLRVHAISHKARVGSNMLNGMLHLTESAALSWRSVYWFTIDYILLADAAVKCRAFFSALLYIEVWCEEAGHGFPHSPLQALGQCNSSSNAPVIEKVRRLLLEIYSNIEEPDSLYAVADGLDLHSQLKRFEREGKWDQALVTYDVGLQSHCFVSSDQLEMMTEKEATDGILRCLNNLGMNTVHNYMLNAMRQQSFMNDSTTHHALSLSEWRPLQPQKKRDSSVHGAQINGDLALALAALKTGDSDACYQAVVSCRQSLVYSLGTEGQESSSDVNPALVQLQLVHLMSEGWNFAYPRLSNFAGSANLHKVGHSMLNREEYKRQFDESWQYYLQNVWGRYNLLFPIQDLRREILHNCGEYDEEAACLTDMIKLARKAGRVGQALGYLGRLKSLVGHCKDSSPAIATWNIESAKLSWAREERTQAVHHLKSFVFNYRGSCTDQQERNELMTYADVLVAKWMGISQTGKPDEILNALKRARHRVEFSTGDTKPYNPVLGCRIVYRLAQYADLLYRNLDEKMSSSDWKAMVHVIRKNTSDYKRLSAESGSEHFRNTIGQRLAEDIQEYNKANERITELRLIAISNYGYCMRIGGNKYDLQCAFRLVQFWLDNGENDKIVECVDSQLKQIPSYKFLPLINQIASRIASSDQHTAFQNSLRRLLIRMCGEHPFHTVVKLIALKNGNLDLEGNGKLTYHADEGRMEAARCVLEEVEVSNMYLRTILSQLTRAVDVFIALADIPVNKEQSKMRFPLNLKKELLSLEHIPVLSLSLPVDPSMKYDGNQMTDVSMPRVVSIMDVITIPGGVNKPKKVTLTTTQGKEVSLLVKKEKFEDIRQDAIMQQFFRTVNSLLADSLETRSRNLRIRTYNVVPLKPRCGLVEWVDNTRPLMSIIDDEAYRKDVASTVKGSRKYSASVPQLGLMSFDTAYSRFSKTDKESITKKREIFDTIVARLRPVLHAFFLANYQDPGSWFKARLTYTRSTAVASIAGHIVGLGDRHNSNILLDTSTAEVVHIDLGIAFEQGKYLPIPERVPFRLTSNVKDGMGVNGVNGVMKKCSEQTLLVLRSNKDALLTVLGVVIHDPLYKWGLTLVQANRRQGKETYGETANADALIGNADADRTLLRIKHKLEGLETGTGSSAPRSVEGQVDYLIEEAQNPDNLCRMYIGWRPYF